MACAKGGFSDQQFQEACTELRQPALSGADWELLVEASGITIYRLLDQPSGLYEYKVFGVLDSCVPALLADVYMDLDYRKQWDQYVKYPLGKLFSKVELKLVAGVCQQHDMLRVRPASGWLMIGTSTWAQLGSWHVEQTLTIGNSELYEMEFDGNLVAYWEVKYPFPMSNRDYVYIRQRRDLDVEGRKVHVVLAQSISLPHFPEKSGVIRVKQYKQSLVIESDGKKGSKVFMYYFDNPGGQIPSWLINWAAKNGIPNFLKDTAKACQNYFKKT